MGISMRLEVRQAQSLALTPQLLQSIRILQYDNADLRDFLRREAERNPLLRLRERPQATRTAAGTRGPDRVAALGTGAPSLELHALAEIAEALPDRADQAIATALLADLDDAGYLRVDEDEAALTHGVAPERIGAILRRLRAEAEPAGLFARDLADCLAIQLARRGRLDPVAASVLSRLDLVARGEVAALCRLTGEDADGVREIVAELRALDPRPGFGFAAGEAPVVVPDVRVARAGPGGGWRVTLLSHSLPRLGFDEDYASRLRGDPAARAFAQECRTGATWLANALEQRARTIMAVAGEIVRRQEGFLAKGAAGLKPMTLAAVADAVGLHESTVSRAVANKYMATPRGTVAFKLFFSGGVAASDGGAAHAATSVRERIRRLVAAEGSSVLSDDEIAGRLRAEGVELARRTIAKYRDQLAIPSSAQRRRALRLSRIAS